jgi:hypothetical protein
LQNSFAFSSILPTVSERLIKLKGLNNLIPSFSRIIREGEVVKRIREITGLCTLPVNARSAALYHQKLIDELIPN